MNHKHIIYQLFVRWFGNRQTANVPFGSCEENGAGTFSDITDRALTALRDELGITHVWYTGVLNHATLTDYAADGQPANHPAVVKGRAGSPYAIRDYYDVAPDLAVRVPDRLAEFEALLTRTHAAGLQALIDFVPNHVARQYAGHARPPGVPDLGAADDPQRAFAPQHQFYYLPGTTFRPPDGHPHLLPAAAPYHESPARATGNDVFDAAPSLHDWFETIKLNYGVDYAHGQTAHFDPVPATWVRMAEILHFWARKGVDGFRCDMVELVPPAFWQWAIAQLRADFPALCFVAEVYQPHRYGQYLAAGFDYLYDKSDTYDGLRGILQHGHSVAGIADCWRAVEGFEHRMLRFLENHDEQRLASRHFLGAAEAGLPGMAVAALLGRGPVLLYSGQEVGEASDEAAGYSGADGRTTIFDYWGVPTLQAWYADGACDGRHLTPAARQLRTAYGRLLRLAGQVPAFRAGHFYDLHYANGHARLYAFLRYLDGACWLVVVNFDREQDFEGEICVPAHALQTVGLAGTYVAQDALGAGEAGDLAFDVNPVQDLRLVLRLAPSVAQAWRWVPVAK